MEERFYMGPAIGGILAWGMTGAGVAYIARALTASPDPSSAFSSNAAVATRAPVAPPADPAAFLAAATPAAPIPDSYFALQGRPNAGSGWETSRNPVTAGSPALSGQTQAEPYSAVAPGFDLTDWPSNLLGDDLDGLDSPAGTAPPRSADPGLPPGNRDDNGGGSGGGAPGSPGLSGAESSFGGPLDSTPFLPGVGTPATPAAKAIAGPTTVTPGGPPNFPAVAPPQAPNPAITQAARNDPMWVLDANKAIVVTPGVTQHDFANWPVDLRAQVASATVSTYSWNLSSAPDATSVSGSSTYRLQFTWANFSGSARTDTISVTETPTVGSAITQTLTFKVASTSSPAYVATPPTSASTWPGVLTPDALTDQQAVGGAGPYYALGLTQGDLQTSHALPSYNPGVPALGLVYSSAAANAQPVFITHFQIDPSQAVPATVSAQLTLNGTAGTTFYYDSSSLNPGDTMQIALQGNATSLSTGRYSYQIAVTANYGTPVTTTYSGSVDIVNDASSPFGAGWSLNTLERIWPVTGGVILEIPGGLSLWFANGGQAGTFVTPAGDFSTLSQNTGTGVYTRTMKDGTKITFNSSGLQTGIVDRNGNTLAYGYNGSNQLITITDPYNLVTTLAYNGQGNVSTITDPANRVTSLGYDGSGRLTSIQDPDTAITSLAYDSSNRLTTYTNGLNFSTTVAYNFAGRVSGVTRPDSTSEQLSALQMQGLVAPGSGTQSNPASPVLAAQAQATDTDPRNNAWQIRLDWLGFGRSGQALDPLSDMTVNYRDANGLPWLSSDPLGRRSRSFYDTRGNPTTIVLADDSTQLYAYNGFSEATKYTDPTSFTTSYSFDSNGNLTQVQNALGGLTTYTVNAQGFVTSVTDPLNHTTSLGYDSRNRQVTQTDALGHVSSFGYDTASDQTTATNPLGFTSSYAYDAMGRLTQTQLPDSNPNNHPTTTAVYDLAGNRIAAIDALNNRTTYGFDRLNRLIATTDPLNHTSSLGYDGAGNQVTATDALTRTTTSAFDAANRRTAVTDAMGKTTTYVLDAAGQQLTVTDPLNRITSFTYTVRGWLATITDPLWDRTTYSYNANGDLLSTTKGHVSPGNLPGTNESSTQTVDALHRVTSKTDALSKTTTLGYDAASNQTSTQDPLGHTTTTAFDALNRPVSMKDAAGHVSSYGYDLAGNRITVTDPLGRVTSYAFDAQNRQVTVIDPRGAVTSYAYDLVGRQVALTDPVGNTTSYTFDAAGRLTATTDPLGTATYAFDAANQLTGKTDKDGRQTSYAFDLDGRRTTEAGSMVKARPFTQRLTLSMPPGN
jgi:YD repeat-containing protein